MMSHRLAVLTSDVSGCVFRDGRWYPGKGEAQPYFQDQTLPDHWRPSGQVITVYNSTSGMILASSGLVVLAEIDGCWFVESRGT